MKYFAVCAFTGKAAQVLRRKGVMASIIHSLIYKPIEEPDGSVRFELKDSLDVEFDGVIVDEASMVSEYIYLYATNAYKFMKDIGFVSSRQVTVLYVLRKKIDESNRNA